MASNSRVQPQQFDYFIVLDFEATCEENMTLAPQVPCTAWSCNFLR